MSFAGEPVSWVTLLLEGLLEFIRSHEEGRELVIALIRPGEVLGVLALIGHFREPHTIRVRTDSEVCSFRPEVFRRLLSGRPHLAPA